MASESGTRVPCRRCSDCRGAEHHWIDNSECYGPEDPSHECKHCDAFGNECEACAGEGGEVVDIGERENGGVALCPPCKGYGVVEVSR